MLYLMYFGCHSRRFHISWCHEIMEFHDFINIEMSWNHDISWFHQYRDIMKSWYSWFHQDHDFMSCHEITISRYHHIWWYCILSWVTTLSTYLRIIILLHIRGHGTMVLFTVLLRICIIYRYLPYLCNIRYLRIM